MVKKSFLMILAMISCTVATLRSQTSWQQKIKYRMDVSLDVATHLLKGKQQIEYTNNSPDSIDCLFFNLYWNAFQPNSMMDVRNRELSKKQVDDRTDWDFQIADKIVKLKPDETGYQKLAMLKVNGKPQNGKWHIEDDKLCIEFRLLFLQTVRCDAVYREAEWLISLNKKGESRIRLTRVESPTTTASIPIPKLKPVLGNVGE